jgi:protocadherin-16/23
VETLEVAVSDAGSPPRSSTGLVEITIEGGPAVSLSFQEDVYRASVAENPLSGQDLTQVRAVRSDGRRQRVIYTFLRGNDLGAFEINSNNGLIRVRDPELIDFERSQQFNLTISGQGLGDDGLTAYTTCVVAVEDVNDHAPKFSRDVYEAKVLEGNSKGSLIVATNAVDQDGSSGEPMTYEIIDGNVDGAFVMRQDRPGIVLTNTVLDREIKEIYELTISATDGGVPPLVGLAQVVVRVVDVNDNRPHFAPVRPIQISKDTPAGSVVTVLRANDIDLSPQVTYRLDRPNDYFSLDTYTGQLILLKRPSEDADAVAMKPIKLSVLASDTVHEARTKVEIAFTENGRRCRPDFSQPIYSFFASSNDSTKGRKEPCRM